MRHEKIIERMAFWSALYYKFIEFEPLLKPCHALTIEDRTVLKKVHGLLYEAFQDTKRSYNRNNKYRGLEK